MAREILRLARNFVLVSVIGSALLATVWWFAPAINHLLAGK